LGSRASLHFGEEEELCVLKTHAEWKDIPNRSAGFYDENWVNTRYVDSFNVILLMNKCTRMKTKYIQTVIVIKF